MKGKIKLLLRNLFVNDLTYHLFRPLVYASSRITNARNNFIQHRDRQPLIRKCDAIFHTKRVLHGPFKGMLMEGIDALASASYAKLLGSYESEIHPFIQLALDRSYDSVINIGCDEGYYSVGFAIRLPGVKVMAADINPAALQQVSILAKRNKVDKQIALHGKFTASHIQKLDEQARILLIVDAEGDEKNIFTQANHHKLSHADMIIELHLDIDPMMKQYFTDMFSDTHDIDVVNSVDDHLKASEYNYPELAGLDYGTKRFITGERSIFMQWIMLHAKNR